MRDLKKTLPTSLRASSVITEESKADVESGVQEEKEVAPSCSTDGWKGSLKGWSWIHFCGIACTCGILAICLFKLSAKRAPGKPSLETNAADVKETYE